MNNYNSPFNQIKYFFNQNNIVVKLIKINIGVWIAVILFNIVSNLYKGGGTNLLVFWLSVHKNLDILKFSPWSIFTYMFLHEDIWHIFSNMIMLYFGGVLFMQFLNARLLLKTYVFGGLMGGIFYVLAYNIFPIFQNTSQFSYALGASASVLAIIVAVGTYAPNNYVSLFFIGNVKLKYIALIFVIIDLSYLSNEKAFLSNDNIGGHIAHLGGALYGFLMAFNLKNHFFKFPSFSFDKIFIRKPKMKYSKTEQPKRPMTDDEYNRIKAEKQKKIDAILDKISKKGYDSLSKEEKELLFKSSNKS